MIRRLSIVLTVTAMGVAIIAPAAHATGPRGAACELTGKAFFTPGLTAKPNMGVKYTFTGSLTNCQSTDKTLKSGVLFCFNY